MIFLGSDPHRLTAKVLGAVLPIVSRGVQIDAVFPDDAPGRSAAASLGAPSVRVHFGVADMAAIMAEADLAIGAAGTTTWERCCLGLPSIVIAVSQNQESSAAALGAEGKVIYLGSGKALAPGAIADTVKSLLDKPHEVKRLSAACAELVDGKGAERVLHALDTQSIMLRTARSEDVASIYEWRNAQETRRFSTQPGRIPREEHDRWFSRVLADPGRALLIGERAGKPIGVLRFDGGASECTVSVYLVPGNSGRGYGARLLLAGAAWLKHHRPHIHRVVAHVLPENRASLQAFLQAGYVPTAGHLVMRLA
jgi:RimJ/RimL family protein N-acetyltransferase